MSFRKRVPVDIITGTCSKCGKVYTYFPSKLQNSIFKGMMKYKACPNCASWLTRKNKAKYKEEMIDGKLYMLLPYKKMIHIRDTDSDTEYRGFAVMGEGDVGFVMDIKTLKTYQYKSKILVGEPPEPFRTPDTAIFVTRREGVALKEGPFECQGCTCMDRYTCVLYFKEKLEAKGAANRIPKGWVDGGERCHNYININNASKILIEWRKKRQEQ